MSYRTFRFGYAFAKNASVKSLYVSHSLWAPKTNSPEGADPAAWAAGAVVGATEGVAAAVAAVVGATVGAAVAAVVVVGAAAAAGAVGAAAGVGAGVAVGAAALQAISTVVLAPSAPASRRRRLITDPARCMSFL